MNLLRIDLLQNDRIVLAAATDISQPVTPSALGADEVCPEVIDLWRGGDHRNLCPTSAANPHLKSARHA